MAEIRWSMTAESDLRQIEEFIAKDSRFHAVNFVGRLVDSAEVLKATPMLGRIVP